MDKMKEIGGYFEMEELMGQEYYPNLIPLNLGRTALKYLISNRRYKKIYLPYYICNSVIEACEKSGVEIKFYYIDKDMCPLLEREPENNACVYLVNYYGQTTDSQVREYQNKYKRIIMDYVHAFYQQPLKGIDTLYSCRKFFGLPDGAYLSSDIFEENSLPIDYSSTRMTHILGRYEKEGSQYYQTMLNNASSLREEPVKKMSRLTHNLLRGIDYSLVRKKREDNYSKLEEKLGRYNKKRFSKPKGPMCFPFYVKGGELLRKRLVLNHIYIPVYWRDVMLRMSKSTVEYDYAENILALPCDQRYGTSEMEWMADKIIELLTMAETNGE